MFGTETGRFVMTVYTFLCNQMLFKHCDVRIIS